MVQNVEPQNLHSRKNKTKQNKKKKKTPFYYVYQFSKKMRPTHIYISIGSVYLFFFSWNICKF